MMEPMSPSLDDSATVPTAQPKRLTRKTVDQGQLNSAKAFDDDNSEISRITNPPRNINRIDTSDLTKQDERERAVSASKVQDQAYILGGRNLSPNKANSQQIDKKSGETAALGDVANTPYTILEPLRSDPIEEYKVRQRRLERVPAEGIPEIHFIGQIKSCIDIVTDSSEGVSIR